MCVCDYILFFQSLNFNFEKVWKFYNSCPPKEMQLKIACVSLERWNPALQLRVREERTEISQLCSSAAQGEGGEDRNLQTLNFS